jgi:ribosome biogenesis GTPase A
MRHSLLRSLLRQGRSFVHHFSTEPTTNNFPEFVSSTPQLARLNWFPGHMTKALRHIDHQLSSVNAVIEIRDARIPFSSANHQFDEMVQERKKPRFVVFTKSDLSDMASRKSIQNMLLEEHGISSTHTIATRPTHIKKIIKKSVENVNMKFKMSAALLLVVGMPNAGKSTLINTLRTGAVSGGKGGKGKRKSRVAKTGSIPGITRQVSSIQVVNKPAIFVLDTPGIMVPRIDNIEVGLKLGLTGALPEKVIDSETMVEYLLWVLNREYNEGTKSCLSKKCWDILGVSGPTLDVHYVLDKVAMRYGKNSATNDPALFCLSSYRKGLLGHICLDKF